MHRRFHGLYDCLNNDDDGRARIKQSPISEQQETAVDDGK